MPKRSDLEPLIRQEWLKRSPEHRTENDVLAFSQEHLIALAEPPAENAGNSERFGRYGI